MNLDRALQIASRFLAFTGLLSLAFTREISFPYWSSTGVFLAASFYSGWIQASPGLSRRIWGVLNALALAYFVLDLFVFSQSLLLASTHFILYLMVNKSYNLKTPQDHLQLYMISLLQLLAASTFTIEISFIFSFVLFLLAAVWALLIHHLAAETLRDSASSGSSSPVVRYPGLTWPFVLSTNAIAVGALGFTLILFILLPRVGLGFFHRAQSDLIRTSGFSEEVDLGEIGSVKLDSTVVMRIQTSRPLPPREGMYWRGMVFDLYDGRAWRNRFGIGPAIGSEGGGVIKLAGRWHPTRELVQEVMLEPLDSAVLFAAPFPVRVTGRFSSLRQNAMGAVSLGSVPATRINYIVTSEEAWLSRADAAMAALPPLSPAFDSYLQLPPVSDRLRRLALDIAGAAGPDATVLQKVLAVEKYLETRYRYTLDVKSPGDRSPIEDFLFHQKAGFCEHYATSMALLLRSLGIPARLVTGFLPGEWNEFGKYYTVRQSDAHAWVEVWFPESGWFPFDPTPAAPGGGGSLLGWVGRTADSLQWRWNRYVIYYSFRDQVGLVQGAQDQGRKLQVWMAERAASLVESFRGWALSGGSHPFLGWAALTAAALVLLWFGRRWRPALGRFWNGPWTAGRWAARRPRRREAVFYLRMLDLLRLRGFEKPAGKTPREFAEGLPVDLGKSGPGSSPPSRGAVTELTELYYRVRFGTAPLSAPEEKRVADLLSLLKRDLSHS